MSPEQWFDVGCAVIVVLFIALVVTILRLKREGNLTDDWLDGIEHDIRPPPQRPPRSYPPPSYPPNVVRIRK
jgi:hypothetical protein